MINKMWRTLGFLGLFVCFSCSSPAKANAAEITVETSTTLYAKMDGSVTVRETAQKEGEILSRAKEGRTYEVVKSLKNGWLKINTPEGEGYIPDRFVTLIEKTQEKVDESAVLRRKVVDYALQFVGGRYVYGGGNPNTGVDCSGFTRYVLKQAAGVDLSHSARAQAGEGDGVTYEKARPGDLVFYARHGSINHVGLYMGDGRVVHASSAKTGIIVRDVMYRKPVKFVNVLK